MKYKILIFLLLISSNIIAQIKTYQLSLIDSSKAILYIGTDNRIRFANLPNGATFSFSNGSEVLNTRGDRIVVNTHHTGPDTLMVSKGRKVLLKEAFVCEHINNPRVSLGIVKDSLATIDQILAMPELRVYIPNCFLKPYFRITHFGIAIYSRHQLLYNSNGQAGSRLLEHEIDIIKRLRRGDKIVFTEIVATCANCTRRNLGGFTLTII